jgi:hypothetical protein
MIHSLKKPVDAPSLKRGRPDGLESEALESLQEHKEAAAGVKTVVETNRFQIRRPLQGGDIKCRSYATLFGRDFLETLDTLKEKHRWTDLGAGRAVAMRDFLHQRAAKREPVPHLLAVGIKKPEDDVFLDLDRMEHRRHFSYMEQAVEKGRKLPKAELVTDCFGAFSYTNDLTQVLQKIGDMLQVGGSAWIVSDMSRTTLLCEPHPRLRSTPEHPTMDLKTWFSSIQGMKASFTDTSPGGYRVKLTKTHEKVQVPLLRFEYFEVGCYQPPRRVFSVVL